MAFLLRNAELLQPDLQSWKLSDVVVSQGRIERILPAAKAEAAGMEEVVDAEGRALLMGLHDHHIHLMSLAESLTSLKVGPPEVTNAAEFHRVLNAVQATNNTNKSETDRSVFSQDWVRAVGYHESVAGHLGKDDLDGLLPHRPVKVQHSSGAMWMLNSLAMRLLGLSEKTSGAELDENGKPTGRFFRSDTLLRLGELGDAKAVDNLLQVGKLLAGFGVTGLTDATPGYGATEVGFFSQAVADKKLSQRLKLMTAEASSFVSSGPHKIILSDHSLPSFEQLAQEVCRAHDAGRPVAVHCVTRASLALLVAALDEVGSLEGDRVEHASVAPPELVAGLLRHNVRVVTQPNFIAEKGDRYLEEVEADDISWLYRCGGLREAGLRLAGSTDAPFGDPNPWKAIWAAVTRLTQPGATVLGEAEQVTPEQALGLFLSPLDDPGGQPRLVEPKLAADLCLLESPWGEVVKAMPENPVNRTWIGGIQAGSSS